MTVCWKCDVKLCLWDHFKNYCWETNYYEWLCQVNLVQVIKSWLCLHYISYFIFVSELLFFSTGLNIYNCSIPTTKPKYSMYGKTLEEKLYFSVFKFHTFT
jgi:hypothetical protein